MSDSHVTFVAKVMAQPGKEGQLAEAVANLIEPTRKEAGCLYYVPHVSAENPAEIVIYESWRSEADFNAHTKTAHFAAVGARMPELCAGPPTREMLRPLRSEG